MIHKYLFEISSRNKWLKNRELKEVKRVKSNAKIVFWKLK